MNPTTRVAVIFLGLAVITLAGVCLLTISMIAALRQRVEDLEGTVDSDYEWNLRQRQAIVEDLRGDAP